MLEFSATRDLTFRLSFWALVKMTNHAQIALRGLIHEMQAEHVMLHAQEFLCINQIPAVGNDGFAQDRSTVGIGDFQSQINGVAMVIYFYSTLHEPTKARHFFPEGKSHGAKQPHFLHS